MKHIGLGMIDAVIWDWNGTLLDDVEVARAAMNTVLRTRDLAEIPDNGSYRRVFGFPIRAFYAQLGVDEAEFVAAADEYLARFAGSVGAASLHSDARTTLAAVDALDVEQVLISATPEDTLERQLAPHAVSHHFAQIRGITDVYAASKEDVVATWLAASGHAPGRVVMVGDTNHDEEIADALCVRFIRFRNGHQDPPSHGRHAIIGDLGDVLGHLRPSAAERV
ncbi:MAG TPA: HAD hydrolase-like protein [Plantibacter sp.]|uniref:HAD family hydrolase n=1 Tax=unclassified Plantibacter TaxID=2624265 RepID=UPI002B8BC751|nr:HAD hydrolase-like protein [Plantibacter sp.]